MRTLGCMIAVSVLILGISAQPSIAGDVNCCIDGPYTAACCIVIDEDCCGMYGGAQVGTCLACVDHRPTPLAPAPQPEGKIVGPPVTLPSDGPVCSSPEAEAALMADINCCKTQGASACCEQMTLGCCNAAGGQVMGTCRACSPGLHPVVEEKEEPLQVCWADKVAVTE